MGAPSRALQRYVGGLAVIAVLVVALLALTGSVQESDVRIAIVLLLGICTVVAQQFPVQLSGKTKVYVDAAFLTALALLAPPAAAALVAAGAVAVNQALLRQTWTQAIFNVAQTAIYVGMGAVIFGSLDAALAGSVGTLLAVLAAAVVMHAINTLAVAAAISLQLGRPLMQSWWADLWLDFPQHVALVATGTLLAAVAARSPWMLPLFVPPLVIIHASLRRSTQVRATADATTAATGDIIDVLTRQPAGHSRRVAAWTGQLAAQLGFPAAEQAVAVRSAHLHGASEIASPDDEGPFQPGMRLRTALRRSSELARVEEGDLDPVSRAAALVAVADAFDDVLQPTTGTAIDEEVALREFTIGRGQRWDPRVIDALAAIVGERRQRHAAPTHSTHSPTMSS